MPSSCCAGALGRGERRPGPVPEIAAGRPPDRDEALPIPGGRTEVGTDSPVLAPDGEGPCRRVTLRSFRLDAAAVTNERFARFAAESGYMTEAERFGWSFVFRPLADPSADEGGRVVGAEWWQRVEGACWRAPEGPGSTTRDRPDHPVVHVSASDASAYAAWAGGRLPGEAEWEHAARAGRRGIRFPWGDDEPDDADVLPCNIWQGEFPRRNTGADGWLGTAPARSFGPNPWGLYNLCGNVWEWTADRFRVRSLSGAARRLNEVSVSEDRRVLKGGSFLCHRSYCYRYRIAARIGNPPDTATSHVGFRLAYDA